jgi:AcrR family transcriptional regulator
MPEVSAAGADVPSRRDAILDAALVEFNAKGVAGTSIADIRRRSGASVGSIYHHFGDKEGIASALHLEGLIDYQGGFLAALTGATGARDGVERGVRHHVQWIARHPDRARFMLLGRDAGLTLATERPLRELNRRFFGAVQRWVAPLVENGELRELSPEVLTALWIGPSQELARHWLAGRTRVNPAEAAPVLAEAAWKSMTRGDDPT